MKISTGNSPLSINPPEPVKHQRTGIYTVERGDTLSGIAVRMNSSVSKLLSLNPHILHPDQIFPEDVLHVPLSRIYSIRSGDTLSDIATHFQVPLQALIDLNRVEDPDRIYPGEQLLIPETRQVITPPLTADVEGKVPQFVPHGHITEAEWHKAASALGVDIHVLKAVSSVESREQGFLPDGRPVIAFEAHQFSNRTGHRYDESHPLISSRLWDKSLYQSGSAEHDRLELAMKLDSTAALASTSWGKFQIMGFNYAEAGFDSVEAFVLAMGESEVRQLEAFVHFIRANPQMHEALAHQDWSTFAKLYNGPAYALNDYDERIERAFEKLSA